MLKPETIKKIRVLLSEKRYSQRTVAKIVGVSRGTVSAVALGKRKIYLRKSPDWAPPILSPKGRPQRCALCGALVQMPCLACQLRNMTENRNKDFSA